MPSRPSHARRPSLSNWLARASSNSSAKSSTSTGQHVPYAPSKPVRISEPKFIRSLESLNQLRSGTLGSGAEVVRTPQEALSRRGVQVSYEHDPDSQASFHEDIREEDECTQVAEDELPFEHGLPSPELPPLPRSASVPDFELNQPSLSSKQIASPPPPPSRAPPPPPPSRPLPPPPPLSRPTMKQSITSEYFPEVPLLPANILPSTPQPPFEAILVSGSPSSAIDPSKVIVSLETETKTYRTTINTLTSRPSDLSSFVMSLMPKKDLDDCSVYSEDLSTYHNFITSQGLLSTTSFTLHIFLDRPSAPYAHILNYLRSIPSSPETPEALPHGIRLQSSSRLEALLELRDEALYLDLQDLYKLCNEEIRQRLSISAPSRRSRRRCRSGSSSASLTLASVSHDERSVSGIDRTSSMDDGVMAKSHGRMNSQTSSEVPARSLATSMSVRPESQDSLGGRDSSDNASSNRLPQLPLSGRWI